MKNKVLMVLVSTFLMLSLFSFVSANINDYIIYYPMNENSGITVQNLGTFGEDGTSSGIFYNSTSGLTEKDGLPSIQFIDGKVGGGYDFGEYTIFTLGNPVYYNISLVDTNYDTPLTDVSVFAWVKPKNLEGQLGDGTLILFSQGFEYGGWGFLITDDGNLEYYLAGVGGWVTSGLNLQEDTWYRIGFTYNGTNMKMYVNGVEQLYAPTDSFTNIAYGNLTIGWRTHSQPSAPYFGLSNATFDEVKVWDRPLSDSEVAQDYNSYNPVTPIVTQPNGAPLHYDNLITPTEPTPTTPVTGAVTTQPKASFGLFQGIKNFFTSIGNWFSKFFGFL